MDCEDCGAYTRYQDFCGHWLCDRCAEQDDMAAEAAEYRSSQPSN